jgi:hypothetical protein
VLADKNKAANRLGFLSLTLSVIPVVYIFHPDAFPNHALTETLVLIGGVGGSLLFAEAAGLVGSGLWFIAILGTTLDVVVLWLFNP